MTRMAAYLGAAPTDDRRVRPQPARSGRSRHQPTSNEMDALLHLFVRDAEDDAFDLEREIEAVASQAGWDATLAELMLFLARPDRKEFWYSAAAVLYWAVSDRRPLPMSPADCIARLYRCLELFPNLGADLLGEGDNLVWSIAIKLKGLSYETSWQPLDDPEIKERLAALRPS